MIWIRRLFIGAFDDHLILILTFLQFLSQPS